MTTSPEFWASAFYVVAVIALCGIIIGLSALLGPRSGARARNEPFESGVVSASPERLRLSAKFYLVAVFFVIFDVEALYLYAWAISLREAGWPGLVEATIFIGILLASLVYLARIGALDWAPASRKRAAYRLQQGGVGSGGAVSAYDEPVERAARAAAEPSAARVSAHEEPR